MKAMITNQYGTSNVLQQMEVPVPVHRTSEVLIKIHATTVNRTDTGFLCGLPKLVRLFTGLLRPKHNILGNEFAGEIAAVGSDVKTFQTGDRVFGYNDARFGAHAEYIAMPANGNMATIPPNFSHQEAAPLAEGAHYALCDLRAAKIQAGQNILINGATGAIGSAAVQLAKYFGAHITATCATAHLELVKNLGADVVIDYTTTDFTQLNSTFDLVFDAVGKSSFGQCKRLLKAKGIYVSTELGAGGQNVWLAIIKKFTGGKRVLFPIPSINQNDVIFLQHLAASGKFKPVIDRIYSFEEIPEAYDYAFTGQKTGNVVIKIIN